MKTRKPIALAVLAALAILAGSALPAGSTAGPPHPPREFFGIAPQTGLTPDDTATMRAGGIGSVRWPLIWEQVQPTREGEFDWSSFDQVVAEAARQRLRVLPFFYGTPAWLARKYTILPIDSERKRALWRRFVREAVLRYGPTGDFWREHAPASAEPLPRMPIREWQVWNEANFFYFATPASPQRYARLLRITSATVRSVEPSARIILTGLFGEPSAKPPNALPAVTFLKRLYRVPGIKSLFDGVALHPYADGAARLEEMVEEVREVIVENRDPAAHLYLTELGWGSQNNPHIVSFERGIRGQVKEMRLAYEYMLANRWRLRLKGAYWFTWKDLPDVCNFCDSVGFFREGDRLRPKPVWHAFVRISRGRARP